MSNISRRSKTYETLSIMLRHRGYDQITCWSATNTDTEQDSITILYLDDSPTLLNLKSIIELEFAGNIQGEHILVVISQDESGITPSLYSYASEQYQKHKTRIELFREVELQFVIIKHQDVPRHTLLNPNEIQALNKKYEVKNLPCMVENDPVAKFYGAMVDDVFRIDRPSIFVEDGGTAVTSVYYRRVVPGLMSIKT
jgi:DNA-directed RNA polymerase subunit H (RpoH/RPB5)